MGVRDLTEGQGAYQMVDLQAAQMMIPSSPYASDTSYWSKPDQRAVMGLPYAGQSSKG